METVLEKVCKLIPATPEILLQWMTHVDYPNDDTFAIICVLVNEGCHPQNTVHTLNELAVIIGEENIISLARELKPIDDFEIWFDRLRKMDLGFGPICMLSLIIRNLELYDQIKILVRQDS